MAISIPELSLVVLAGPWDSERSAFARAHFDAAEILAGEVALVRERLAAGWLTAVDAPNLQPEARRQLVALAREFHVPALGFVFAFDRAEAPRALRHQAQQLRQSRASLEREGFRQVHIFENREDSAGVAIERAAQPGNRRHEQGPFDIIGDVHGCFDELLVLLGQLGYRVDPIAGRFQVTPPAGRKAIFVGDFVDRGPKTPETLRLAMAMAQSGTALCVPGNHDAKLLRKLRGHDVQIAHGLASTLAQLEPEPAEFKQELADFLESLPSHYVLDAGKLVVAHAGLKEELQGRDSAAVRDFALYGETKGEIDSFGLPVRLNWAADYRGRAMVVYGHTPVAEPQWLNGAIDIDTGCVYGGKLTALRYPEKELVSVPALRVHYAPAKAIR